MKDIFILLLQKKFSGEISPAEMEQLETWLRQSPEHEREALVLEQIWVRSAGYELPFEPDLDADFTALQARLHAEARPAAKVVRMWPAFARVAAAVAVLLLSYWGWQHEWGTASQTVDAVLLEKSNGTAEKELLVLSDGSRVWLRRGASVRYPAAFDNKGHRAVFLNGEAYFQVSHRPEQPFRVQLPEGRAVEVLGTEFNVKAEPNGTEVLVLVRSGKVRFTPDAQSAGAVLTAGQKAVFDPTRSQIRVTNTESLNELAWQSGGLEFVRTPLAKVLSDIETYHGVRIELRNAALRNCLYTSVLNKDQPDNLLKTVAAVFHLTLEKRGAKAYILSGGSCR